MEAATTYLDAMMAAGKVLKFSLPQGAGRVAKTLYAYSCGCEIRSCHRHEVKQ